MLRAALKGPFAEHRLGSETEWRRTVLTMWDEATHREERYAAIALAGHRHYREWARSRQVLDLYAHLVRTGAWWDLVDATAPLVGEVLAADPAGVTPVIQRWAHDEDLWVRRTSIICQNKFRERTDLALLTEAIEASTGDRDFFARKAIGWALREQAKTNPAWVRQFVSDHPQLSGLSRREALKHLGQ